MEQKDLEHFQQLLLAWRDELIGYADGTMVRLTDMEDNSPDPSDRATFEEGRGYLLRIRDRESRLIRKINEALERIEDGSYGVCEGCGEQIAIGRLNARPVATYCIACKTRQENTERLTGR
jgi:DnaK suppressor protein